MLGRGVCQKPSHVIKGQSRMSPRSFLNPHQRQRFVSAVICVDAGWRPKANDLGGADLASAMKTEPTGSDRVHAIDVLIRFTLTC